MAVYLAPNARINATHLKNVLKGHGNSFLGNAVFGEDVFAPKRPHYVYTVKPVDSWNVVKQQDKFQAVLFGRVASLPQVTEVGTFILLKHPDWASHGYGKDEFKNLFYSQTAPLDDATDVDSVVDFDNDYHANIRSWTYFGDFRVDIWKWEQRTSFSKADADGVFTNSMASKSGSTFPFAIGDTVIVLAELYRVVVDHDEAPTYRGYHVFAHHMKQIRILPKSHVHGPKCDCNAARKRMQIAAGLTGVEGDDDESGSGEDMDISEDEGSGASTLSSSDDK
ncbi:hypothetical protein R3P38DRAFT_3229677 [Favolaschia claudopus]|uniref:Uncharacterized protein n=1 Tax=Favolaschia claudopus TaxID=2862362 RepID=A0AAV9ZP08_9AGAR